MHSAQECDKHKLIVSKKTVLRVNYRTRFVNEVRGLGGTAEHDSRHTKVYAESKQTPGAPSLLLLL